MKQDALTGEQNPIVVISRHLIDYKIAYNYEQTKNLIYYLIDKGFDYKNADLLIACVNSEYLEMLKFCMEELKLNINYESEEKYLLINSIKYEKYDIAEYLISVGFDKTIEWDTYARGVRDEDDLGKTALDFAIEMGNPQIIRLLQK